MNQKIQSATQKIREILEENQLAGSVTVTDGESTKNFVQLPPACAIKQAEDFKFSHDDVNPENVDSTKRVLGHIMLGTKGVNLKMTEEYKKL